MAMDKCRTCKYMVKRTWMEETYTNGTPLFYCSITPSKLGWSGMLKVKTNQPACNKYINKDTNDQK